jgi:hypothetical protein
MSQFVAVVVEKASCSSKALAFVSHLVVLLPLEIGLVDHFLVRSNSSTAGINGCGPDHYLDVSIISILADRRDTRVLN